MTLMTRTAVKVSWMLASNFIGQIGQMTHMTLMALIEATGRGIELIQTDEVVS